MKLNSKITTIDAEYNKAYKYYQEQFNGQPIEVRRLGSYGDIVTTIREATIYLNEYGDLVPPKLANVMKQRIKAQKKLMVEWYHCDIHDNPDML